jgi:hypothetical protein
MPLLVSLADIRDVVVIVYGVIGIIFFVAALILILVVIFTVRGLTRSVRQMLDESVRPTLWSVRDAAQTVRGTTEFVSQSAVTPVVKVYGTMAGVRKGLSVLTGMRTRKTK